MQNPDNHQGEAVHWDWGSKTLGCTCTVRGIASWIYQPRVCALLLTIGSKGKVTATTTTIGIGWNADQISVLFGQQHELETFLHLHVVRTVPKDLTLHLPVLLRCSQYSFSKNFLTALTKGRGFSTCTAWPLSGIMIISQSSFPLGPSDPHSVLFIISMRIFCEMSLNFASFSPATMSKGLFRCFRSSHRDLVHWNLHETGSHE